MFSSEEISNIIRNVLLFGSEFDPITGLSAAQLERTAKVKCILEMGLEQVFIQYLLTEDHFQEICELLEEWRLPMPLDIVATCEETYDTNTCPICIGPKQNQLRIACGHVFCSPCIEEWLKGNNTCPVCRSLVQLPPTPPVLADLDFSEIGQQIEAASVQYFGRNLLQSESFQDRYIWFHWLHYSAIAYIGQDLIWLRLKDAFWAIFGIAE